MSDITVYLVVGLSMTLLIHIAIAGIMTISTISPAIAFITVVLAMGVVGVGLIVWR